MVEARAAVALLREALQATEGHLSGERSRLEAAERRGRLAADIGDQETVEVARRFAARHREKVVLLERKQSLQRDELAVAERDLEEMTAQLRAVRGGSGAPDPAPGGGAAGEAGAESDPGLRYRMDRAARDAAVDAQLAALKKKLGKE